MTPKEKAIELVNKFYNIIYLDMDYEQAKYAALIAVDEIINSHLSSEKIFDIHPVDYWQEVKQEIDKL